MKVNESDMASLLRMYTGLVYRYKMVDVVLGCGLHQLDVGLCNCQE